MNNWQNNWILGIKGFKPHVRLPGVMLNTVDELLEGGGRRWNQQLIHQSFIAINAEEDLKM